MSIKSFKNATADIFFGLNTKKARRQVEKQAWDNARTLLMLLNTANRLTDVSSFPGVRLEPLKHSKPGYYSIRVNDRFRVIFQWKDGHAYDVNVEDPKHHQPQHRHNA